MRKELMDLVKTSGSAITEEVEMAVEQLVEILDAKDEADASKVLEWLEDKRRNNNEVVEEIGINDLKKWQVDPKTGNISHESGKFFQVVGVRVRGAKNREVKSWSQPLIKQHECGILGILRQKRNGIMYYLLYAKSEPGAIVNPQLSPTLQATASNLSQAHGGKKPHFSEYFEDGIGKVIVNVEHVEDPGRFYLKTNRCMIVEIPEDEAIDAPEEYIWVTLPVLKKLLKVDKAINALARAVLGSI